MNILLINGSLRKNSFNKILAEDAMSALGKAANVALLDYTDVPFYCADDEYPAPAAIKAVREKAAWADAFWFFTPEYNGMIPGVLKNLLDWLSRPVEAGTPRTNTPLFGKPAAISGAGGGRATKMAREQLSTLLKFLGMAVCPDQTGIALPPASFASDTIDEETLKTICAKIDEQASAFVSFIEDRQRDASKV